MAIPWFECWFGKAYKELYPHRDFREARAQVAFLLRELPVTPAWRILDVGCGQGRHLETFRELGFPFGFGLDLSLSLLRDARDARQAVVRGDMRHLPFPPVGFDLVTSFFTSFGYFATLGEDEEVMEQFATVLKPGGNLLLDLINIEPLSARLVPENRAWVDGSEIVQRRRMEGGIVIKEIEIRKPDGIVEKFEERVRLYPRHVILALAERFGLIHVKTFGDESGGAYQSDLSPRMTLLFRKAD